MKQSTNTKKKVYTVRILKLQTINLCHCQFVVLKLRLVIELEDKKKLFVYLASFQYRR